MSHSNANQQLKVIFDEVYMQTGGVTAVPDDAKLTKEQLDKGLASLGKQLTSAELDDLFEKADDNGDGGISFDEFVKISKIPDEAPVDVARACVAEFLGTALFQFFGGLPSAGAWGNGITLVVLIYATASISGGNLNPAVSFALAITSQISWIKMLGYWVAQIAGAVCGAAWVYAIDNGSDHNVFGVPKSSCTLPGGVCVGNPGKVFGVEFLSTFVLVFTVFATAVDPKGAAKNAAPIAIGFSLYAIALGTAPLTGAALNPARTLGPALVFNCWSAGDGTDNAQWAYVLAQLIAGAAAGLIYKFVFLNRPDDGVPAPSRTFQFAQRTDKAVRADIQAGKGADEEAPVTQRNPIQGGDSVAKATANLPPPPRT